MVAIREFKTVENQTLNIKLPDDFNYKEVEVIILPKESLADDWSYLEEEIDKAEMSGISDISHEELMESIKSKYV